MTDEGLDQIIGNVLRIGVLLAAAVVAAGGVWYLSTHGSGPVAYRHVATHAGSPGVLFGLPGPQAVMLIGLLLLIATPVARVMFSLVAFALERDGTYVAITLIVLAVLLYSIGSAWL